jgi:hypothetical protein
MFDDEIKQALADKLNELSRIDLALMRALEIGDFTESKRELLAMAEKAVIVAIYHLGKALK